jgi:hypothetical protein
MARHRIRIIQVFRTTRSIEIEVETEDEHDAREGVSSGAIDTPRIRQPELENLLGPPE